MSLYRSKYLLLITSAAALTMALVAIWRLTGSDVYTKYRVVETTEKAANPDDPLEAAGFYDGGDRSETAIRSTFRFGLLPTSISPLDKHFIALSTLAPLVWIPPLYMMWRRRHRIPGQRARH